MVRQSYSVLANDDSNATSINGPASSALVDDDIDIDVGAQGKVGSFSTQLRALLLKNWHVKTRKRKELITETIYPIMMTLIICAIKVATKDAVDTYQPQLWPSPLQNIFQPTIPIQEHKLAFAPCNTEAQNRTMAHANSVLQFLGRGYFNLTLVPFRTEAELEEFYHENRSEFWAGVVFNSTSSATEYTIRMKQDNPDEPSPLATIPSNLADPSVPGDPVGCRGNWGALSPNSTTCEAGSFWKSGFIALQTSLQIASACKTQNFEMCQNLAYAITEGLTIAQAPEAEYTRPPNDMLSPIAVMMIIMGFAPLVQFLLVNLVGEKEKGIKESMYLMGMDMRSYWLSWLLTYAVENIIPCALITLISTNMQLFEHISWSCLFVVLYIFALSLTALGIMLSPLFKVAKTAGMAGGLSATIVSVAIFGIKGITSAGARFAMSLLSPLAASLALNNALELEPYGGLNWDNFFTAGDGFSPADACFMMGVDTVLYLALAWVIDASVSGTGPFRFLWHKTEAPLSMYNDGEASENFEQVAPGLDSRTAISIDNVTKEYKNAAVGQRAVALDSINFTMYSDQIFGLLGHNGAGKSTLHRIITGLALPSSGTVRIFGYDMSTSKGRDQIRAIMGVCPQHDILYDDLTITEHLRLYGRIKGVSNAALDVAVNRSVTEMHMETQRHVASKSLSGGQQRKLSVAIALIGDPSVVCLDEPTSGMDPYSRRQLWDLLQSKRKGRCILFTSHQMDEADVLADRKTILSDGKLQCLGSSLFLKSKFGVGYNLSVRQRMDASINVLSHHVNNSLEQEIEYNEVIAATRSSEVREIIFKLPLRCVKNFPQLFETFDSSTSALGVVEYGISMTTLEEVFLKLAEEGNHGTTRDDGDDGDDELLDTSRGPVEEPCDNTKPPSKMSQIRAMLQVKMYTLMRNKAASVFQIVVPCLLLGIAIGIVFKPTVTDNLYPSMTTSEPNGLNTRMPIYVSEATHFNTSGFDKSITTVNMDNTSSIVDLNSDTFAPYAAALIVEGTNVTLVYNSSFYSSLPFFIGPVIAKLLEQQAEFFDDVLANNHTQFSSAPLAYKPKVMFDASSFNAILTIGIAISAVPPGFAIALVFERFVRIKHQLFTAGVSAQVYFPSHFIYDTLQMALPCVTALILTLVADVKPLIGPAFGATFISMILYIPLTVLLVYVMSYMFKDPGSCQMTLPAIFSLAAFMPYIAVGVTDGQGPDHYDTVKMMHYGFCLLDPPYSLLGLFYFIFRVGLVASYTPGGVVLTAGDFFKMENHITPTLLIMLAQIGLLTLALLYIAKAGTGTATHDPVDEENQEGGADAQDDDVVAAAEALGKINAYEGDNSNRSDEYLLKILNLRKSFQKTKQAKVKHAVRGISFGVKKGEIFGLLGPNGAGKTTSMSMMTGAQLATNGDAVIGGHSVKSNLPSALRELGYCPQFSALYPFMTVQEHLKLFATLKGYSPIEVTERAKRFSKLLGITEYNKTQARNLSGGTQRKLSTAIALIVNPSVVLLDEPSTGMDPATRRFMWKIVQDQSTGRATILTTHSMEEAEALCTTIAIMVSGKLRCLGSAQHLKTKFGTDYTLEIKATPSQEAELAQFIDQTFEVAQPLEVYPGYYKYRVRGGGGLARVFRLIENAREKFEIEEFSYSQPSLEQVFLDFAREQIEADLAAEARA
eukprot:m.230022 g.230022  ORF g.230022 m.230022 type:complete len:1672 (+) comp33570_c0_seq1:40-5055(+)